MAELNIARATRGSHRAVPLKPTRGRLVSKPLGCAMAPVALPKGTAEPVQVAEQAGSDLLLQLVRLLARQAAIEAASMGGSEAAVIDPASQRKR